MSSYQWTNLWQVVLRLMHVPMCSAILDARKEHRDGGNDGTSSWRAGPTSGWRVKPNSGDVENSDARGICELKAKSEMQEKNIELLKGRVAEQSRLLQETQEKLSSIERAANQQIAQKAKAIERLEENVAKLYQVIPGQEKTAALYSVVNQEDARRTVSIQRPEANATEFSQGSRNKTEKTPRVEGATKGRSKRPALTIERLETKVLALDSPLQEWTPIPLSPDDTASGQDQRTHDSSGMKQKNNESKPILKLTTEGERANKALPRAPVNRSDTVSVAEVAELVRVLNAQLEQTTNLIVDSLSYRPSPHSGTGSGLLSSELRDYLGSWLCGDLQRRSNEPDSEPDPLMAQITLQTGLVNACSRIVNGWIPSNTSQGAADTRTQARTYSSNQNINEKYLTRILLELINAVGGSLQSGERLPPQHQEKVSDIAKKVVELRRVINEEVVSLELVTYIIPCGTEFSSVLMEDTEGDGGKAGSIPHDNVICTMEMGLQCRKRVERGKPRQEYGVSMKAKVVLASTLEA